MLMRVQTYPLCSKISKNMPLIAADWNGLRLEMCIFRSPLVYWQIFLNSYLSNFPKKLKNQFFFKLDCSKIPRN
jgi:hypothetical protein